MTGQRSRRNVNERNAESARIENKLEQDRVECLNRVNDALGFNLHEVTEEARAMKELDQMSTSTNVGLNLRQDLLGKRILIVFNHVHLLRSMERMQAFVDLLLSIPFPCGVILRTTVSHIRGIKESKDFQGLYATIRVSFGWKRIPPVTRRDVETLCLANGLTDKTLIGELASKSKNLKVTQYYIDRSKKLPAVTQLQLSFFE